MKNIEEIRNEWATEKYAFETKELGGLQAFVREIFECPELFNLKRGYESTKIENRNSEFTIESNKQGRRADFVLFIDSDKIVIPVEVERHNNISAGIKQLINYQNDWNKALGILTDGYHWRFYNNTSYKEFTLDDILAYPDKLLTFWNDYIREENYYLSFFEPIGNDSLFNDFDSLAIDDNREVFFEDITNMIVKFKNKLGLVGYLETNNSPDADKKATEIAYAYLIQFVLYKNLVDNCYSKFNNEFSERVKTIFNALSNNTYQIVTAQVYGISKFISENLYKPFSEEQNYITGRMLESLQKPTQDLSEVSLWLDIIIFIKKYNFASMQNEIFGYIYENYLKELYEDVNKGQYFTDPAVVEYILDEIGFTSDYIRHTYQIGDLDKLSIIDPSCGSGTFLYSATNRIVNALFDNSQSRAKIVEKIINDNIFGLDISEFPLYLAEMNILMRMLPLIINENYNNPILKKIKVFKTNDSIAEFMDSGITARINKTEESNGQMQFKFDSSVLDLSYKSFIRDEDDLKDMKNSMRPIRTRFDFVVGNPPYIGYNECNKQNMLFAELIKQKKIGMSNIYGVNLNTAPNRIKPYAPKPNLYSFFIALGGALLKANGKMSFIIPQTLLTANDLDVIRYYLATETVIEKIIVFDGKMFVGRGLKGKKPIATSSLIFVIRKSEATPNHKISITKFKIQTETDIDLVFKTGVKESKEILQSELVENIDNWNFINYSKEIVEFHKCFKNHTIALGQFREKLNDYDDLILDGSVNINKKDLDDNYEKNKYCIPLIDKKWIRIKRFAYVDTGKFQKAQGSREIEIMLNRRYKILWHYQNPDGFHFVDMPNCIPKFMDYCLATNDERIALFLVSLLRSNLINKYFICLFNISQERAKLLGLRAIKTFFRLPIINKSNEFIQDEIIKWTKEIIRIDDRILSDFVDFTKISMQKFDSIKVENGIVKLINNRREFQAEIIDKSQTELIANSLQTVSDDELNLNNIKNISIIDTKLQSEIKNYVDDLVFALYVGITLQRVGFDHREEISSICKQNKYYNLFDEIE